MKAQVHLFVSFFFFFAVTAYEHCHPSSTSNGLPHPPCHTTGQLPHLPPGACLWPLGASHHNISSEDLDSNCDFVVLDLEFLEVLGKHPKVKFVTPAPAHEGGAYYPPKNEFYFSSTWTIDDLPSKLMKLSMDTGEVSVVFNKTLMPNGMAIDKSGSLIVCQQGLYSQNGFIQRVNLTNLETSVVADNWKGYPFNSPNDVVVKSDGSIWFTDPDYGWVEKFKEFPPKVPNQVYRISPLGVVDVVASGFVKPNGLAFSQDEKLLYVTDTGSSVGDGTVNLSLPHSITVFDVSADGRLSNRKLFASVANLVGSYLGIGVPDGIKVDQHGRVYTANNDGIQVFSTQGKLIGLIRIPSAVNMGFAGHGFNQMIVTNISALVGVQLNAQGANVFHLDQT